MQIYNVFYNSIRDNMHKKLSIFLLFQLLSFGQVQSSDDGRYPYETQGEYYARQGMRKGNNYLLSCKDPKIIFELQEDFFGRCERAIAKGCRGQDIKNLFIDFDGNEFVLNAKIESVANETQEIKRKFSHLKSLLRCLRFGVLTEAQQANHEVGLLVAHEKKQESELERSFDGRIIKKRRGETSDNTATQIGQPSDIADAGSLRSGYPETVPCS